MPGAGFLCTWSKLEPNKKWFEYKQFDWEFYHHNKYIINILGELIIRMIQNPIIPSEWRKHVIVLSIKGIILDLYRVRLRLASTDAVNAEYPPNEYSHSSFKKTNKVFSDVGPCQAEDEETSFLKRAVWSSLQLDMFLSLSHWMKRHPDCAWPLCMKRNIKKHI